LSVIERERGAWELIPFMISIDPHRRVYGRLT